MKIEIEDWVYNWGIFIFGILICGVISATFISWFPDYVIALPFVGYAVGYGWLFITRKNNKNG